MKLTQDQKKSLKFEKVRTGKAGVKLIHIRDVVTIAWVRMFPTSKMISVSTSYFDQTESDKFRKSTGTFYALLRLRGNEFMQLPLGELDDSIIENVLVDMFVV